jgi:hypothetical protein
VLHWVPASTIAFLGARFGLKEPVMPGDPAQCAQSLRAMHALMLAYAGQRRRAAAEPGDAVYWKAAEACALDKARALRERDGFPRLP